MFSQGFYFTFICHKETSQILKPAKIFSLSMSQNQIIKFKNVLQYSVVVRPVLFYFPSFIGALPTTP